MSKMAAAAQTTTSSWHRTPEGRNSVPELLCVVGLAKTDEGAQYTLALH